VKSKLAEEEAVAAKKAKELAAMSPDARAAFLAEAAKASQHDADKARHFTRLGLLAGGGAKAQALGSAGGGGGRGGRAGGAGRGGTARGGRGL
jgi:outer membrane protein TolC